MENKKDDVAVIVWEDGTKASAPQESRSEPARVVPFRQSGVGSTGEPSVVTRLLPGREGEAKPAGTVTYVGSGFWATSETRSGLRMAA